MLPKRSAVRAPFAEKKRLRRVAANAVHQATERAQPSRTELSRSASEPIRVSLPNKLAPHNIDQTNEMRVVEFRHPFGLITGTHSDLEKFDQPLAPVSGTPDAVVAACRTAIESAAQPHGALNVDAVSRGRVRRQNRDVIAPIEVKVLYGRIIGYEARQAQIECRVDQTGRITGAS